MEANKPAMFRGLISCTISQTYLSMISSVLRRRVLFIHIAFSVLLIALLCFWVLARWYPGGLLILQGGVSVLLTVAAVDLVIGPLLTFVLFRPENKRPRELVLDMTLILVLQMGAFGYGTWILSTQRPAYLAFIYDRFFIITAQDVLGSIPPSVKTIQPWLDGPLPVFVKLSFGAEMEIVKTVYGLNDPPPMALLPGAYAPLSKGKVRFTQIQQENGEAHSGTPNNLMRVPIIGRTDQAKAVIDVEKAELLRIEH